MGGHPVLGPASGQRISACRNRANQVERELPRFLSIVADLLTPRPVRGFCISGYAYAPVCPLPATPPRQISTVRAQVVHTHRNPILLGRVLRLRAANILSRRGAGYCLELHAVDDTARSLEAP